jgi:D-beta-D-heptose 7-phosphate kinase/D-beta-D-heptose 1-phosphate adenosyltransferase
LTRQLRNPPGEQGIETRALVVDPTSPTTLKTRIVAHHQQVIRFDREKAEKISPLDAGKLTKYLCSQVGHAAAVVFEDYGKRVLSQKPLDEMQCLARKHCKITASDPNPRNPLRYSGLTAIAPNRSEAFTAAGVTYAEPADKVLRDEPLMRVGQILLRESKVSNLLVTLGEHGMCLFRRGKKPHHIPTVAQEVFDVSGAGDTAIATLVLALAAGADPAAAAEIANHAAGVVVGKIGTATCSTEELVESFSRHQR